MARPGFENHPKFLRLIHILRVPEPHALGYCECMWRVAYQNGDAVLGDGLAVELAAKFPGKPGTLVKALVKVGLIDALMGGKYAVHDLLDHAPEYVAGRAAKEAERKKEKRCAYCDAPFRSTEP